MKIAIIGHTGMGGQLLTQELLNRGHQITGIAIDAEKAPSLKNLTSIKCNILDCAVSELVNAIRDHDVVVSTFSGGHEVDILVYYRQVEATRRIIRAFKKAKGNYLVYIGGAASLYVKPDLQMFDDPRFPKWYFGIAPSEHLRWLGEITHESFFLDAAERREKGMLRENESDIELENAVEGWTHVPLLEGCRVALDLFEADKSFNWSFLSPPWFYRPGEKTGSYILGTDFMLMDRGIPASISVSDLQLAVADEVETQQLLHKHWTAAKSTY
ncbi:NAD(P)H-binding protein [Citrobacter sp. Cb004]|uniref:NAD(P)-dependent oxidoreductase n=1 Tax=Citrobacter sp. Cb004 TaxID=2985006 RepID=UPI00257590DB|nr:NAD(P)H-binding protein [Citrobacter sp. Cb004]MDM3354952.1 NAD(P)H-binding protein [Citrobacter sp. Cb004]